MSVQNFRAATWPDNVCNVTLPPPLAILVGWGTVVGEGGEEGAGIGNARSVYLCAV